MSFSKLSDEFLKQNQIQEKINWPGLMAAGLMALPSSAKEPTNAQAPRKLPTTVVVANKETSPAQSEANFIKNVKSFIKEKEGSNDYNRIKKLHGKRNKNNKLIDPTIGWGHSLRYLNQSKAIFRDVLPDVDFDLIFNKETPLVLSPEQAEKLLNYDIKLRTDTLKRIYPQFLKYDYNTQKALFDLLYRGDLKHEISKNLLQGDIDTAVNKLRSGVSKEPNSIKKRVEDSINILTNSPHFKKTQPTNEPPKPQPKKVEPPSEYKNFLGKI